MSNNCSNMLKKHKELNVRFINSKEKLTVLQEQFNNRICDKANGNLSIYCVGSLARGDIGNNSDLDIFMFFNGDECKIKKVDKIKLFNEIILINDEQHFPELSNDAQYLKIHSFPRMIKVLGSPTDDVKNLFTARMLLLLESKPLFNKDEYDRQILEVLKHYFRDERGKKTFKPLFLLNDILRFWRTLCLNYELIRDDPHKPWRKKNINLKFSRMLSVFGTVLPIIAKPASTACEVQSLVKLSPLERLACGIDMLKDKSLVNHFHNYLDNYEEFLSLKESLKNKATLDDRVLSKRARDIGAESSKFLLNCLTHKNIEDELKKYLIL